MDKFIIGLYKEVGKNPILKKVENTIEGFESLLEGEIDVIPYVDVFIICKKDRERLKANIYLNISFGRIDSNIRGNIFLVSNANDTFKSLTREQVIKYNHFLKVESFSYEHFDESGKYLSNRQLKKRKKAQKEFERQALNNSNYNMVTAESNPDNFIIDTIANIPSIPIVKRDENIEQNLRDVTTNKTGKENIEVVMTMILEMQASILRFIQEYKNKISM